MKRIKVLLGTFIIIMLSFLNATPVYAQEQDSSDEVFGGDEKIPYYFDDEGNPYVIIDNEQLYILLPLPQFKVTDEKIISELTAFSESIEDGMKGAPTSYVDLSTGPNYSNSPTDSFVANFEYYGAIGSPYYKYNTSHATIRVKTTNEVKKNILSEKKITFICYYYDYILDEWYSNTYSDKNCTGINGFGILFTPSTTPYGKFTFTSSHLKSATISIWTSPAS